MKAVMSLVRMPVVTWAVGSLALGALFIAAAIGWLTWKYGSLEAALGYLRGRQLMLLPQELDLGPGEPGERREVRMEIVNLTDRPAKVLGAKSSCSCLIIPRDLPAEIPAHEARSLSAVLTFAGDRGKRSQSVTVYSDLGYVEGTSAVIKSQIVARDPKAD